MVTGVLVAVLVAGCGSEGPTQAPLVAPAGLPPDRVLLAVDEYAGGPLWHDAYAPRIHTLTADGTLVSAHVGQRSRMPRLVKAHLGTTALDALWSQVVSSGLARDGRLDLPGVFDRPTTLFTVSDGARTLSLEVYGLDRSGDVAGAGSEEASAVPAADVPLRGRALALLASLEALAGGEPYDAERVAVYIVDGEGIEGDRVQWAGDLDLATAGSPVTSPAGFDRCVLLEGDAATAIARVGEGIRDDQLVTDGDRAWLVDFVPLLPDQRDPEGCVKA